MTNDVPVPNKVPPVGAEYQSMVTPLVEAVAVKVTDPASHRVAEACKLFVDEMVGNVVMTVASTEVRDADRQPLDVIAPAK